MRFIILLVAIICNSILNAQTITEYRYWFDNDINSGQIVPGSFGNDASISTALQIGTLTSGLHTLHFSAKQNDGKWSSVISDVFYNTGSGGASGYEYWFDTAYSSKKTVLTPSTNNLILTAANLNASGLKNGFHQLNIRFKPNGAMWSGVQSEMFFKRGFDLYPAIDVIGLKYWFDDNISGAKEIRVRNLVANSFLGLFDTEILSLGRHQLSYQIKDNGQVWSCTISDSFSRGPIYSIEHIVPKLFLSKTSLNIGETLRFTGKDIVPNGDIELLIKNPEGAVVDINYLNINYFGDNKNNFYYDYNFTVNDKGGIYSATLKDLTTQKISAEQQFRINKTENTSTISILRPTENNDFKVNENFTLSWTDFVKNKLPNGQTGLVTKKYKIELTSDNGNSYITLIDPLIFRKKISGRIESFEKSIVISQSGLFKIKITDLDDLSNTKLSDQFSVGVSTSNGLSTFFEWDKSCPDQNQTYLNPIGLAADGTSRIIIKLSKNTTNTKKITSVVGTIKPVNSTFSTPNLLGKIIIASNISSYNEDGNAATSISVDNTFSNNPNEINYWLVSPDDFTTDINNFESVRKVKVEFIVSYDSGPDETIETKEIEIVRPPLMFVHGLNGDAETFSKAKFSSNNQTYYFDNTYEKKFFWQDFKYAPLWKNTYKSVTLKNDEYYDVNARILLGMDNATDNHPNSFAGFLNAYHKSGYASNRVDYVCHSMGGDIARTVINKYPNIYKPAITSTQRFKNYNLGFINKLITINTPHNGSPVADILFELISEGQPNQALTPFIAPLRLIGFTGFTKWQSLLLGYSASNAIKDLRSVNGGVRFNYTNGVKTHLIASTFDIGNFGSNKTELFIDFLNVLIPAYNNTDTKYQKIDRYWLQHFGYNFSQNSDLVVPIRSQLPGYDLLQVPQLENFETSIYDAVIKNGPNHLTVTDNLAIGNHVFHLLNSEIASLKFSNGFVANPNPGGSETYGPTTISTLFDSVFYRYDTVNIKFIKPDSNKIYLNDTVLNLRIDLKDTSNLLKVYLNSMGNVYESNSKINNQLFKVYRNNYMSDNMVISISALYDSSGYKVYHIDTLNLKLVENDTLRQLTINPTSQVLNKFQHTNLSITAEYDKFFISKSFPNDSMTYQISDTNIVVFDNFRNQFLTKDTGSCFIVVNYRTYSDTAFIIVSETPQAITLPISLTSFSATKNSCNSTQIFWQTGAEYNSLSFNIETSTNGTEFKKIAAVNGAGYSSSTKNYSYSVNNLTEGNHYFRLKQLDNDGKFSYSPTIVVKINCNTNSITLIPNPASTQITILGLDNSMKHNFQIFDNKGSLIKTINGAATNIINIKDIPNGLYLLKVDNNENLRFLKM